MKYNGFLLTFAFLIAFQPSLAKPLVKKHTAHYADVKRHNSSLYLTTAQRNNGFTNVNYANTYDELGREILKHDPDVKETSASIRDSSNGYYVILGRDYDGTPSVAWNGST